MKNLLTRRMKYSYSNVCLYIIVVNAVIFMMTQMNRELMSYLAMNPLNVSHHGMYWQFVTYMFVHGSMNHIFFNMLGLYFFGTQVERSMGSREFLLFYMVCGILAGVFSYLIYINTGYYRVFLLGASGSVFAVLLAYAVIYPGSVIYIMGVLPVKAPFLVLGYTVIEILSHMSGRNSGVAHMTHLAGFAFAYIYFMVRFRINPADRLFRR